MTQTTQSGSCAILSEPDKDLTISENEEGNNIDLLISVFSGMNRLSEAISKLNNTLKKKRMEDITIFGSLDKLNEALSRLDNAVSYYAIKK